MKISKELIILTGVSGAGKSTAMGYLEDIGYYCIDNLPPQLVDTFLELLKTSDDYKKVALMIDVRSSEYFEKFVEELKSAKQFGYSAKIVYLDVSDAEALKRYKLTRRKHPLSEQCGGAIEEALLKEKALLKPILQNADYVIDTTGVIAPVLRTRLAQILLSDNKEVMNIHCMSFGFKHGIPKSADFVIDVRCLPNPYWNEKLRYKTGLDQEVKDMVFAFDESNQLLEKMIDLLDFLNPLYIKEGKSQVVIAVGCTGGNHRSVAFAEELNNYFSKKWSNVSVTHRDIDKR